MVLGAPKNEFVMQGGFDTYDSALKWARENYPDEIMDIIPDRKMVFGKEFVIDESEFEYEHD